MRLLQERRKGLASTYVYEENAQEETYAPLARLDTPCSLDKAFGKVSLSDNTPKSRFYYYHVNTSGQPEELTDADGKVVWQARYATWGRVLEERSAPGIEQNLRFQGQYFDSETGLCYNTFRYYDPGLGRFITEDPIGLDGGINLYQYGPNPLMWIDPWGWSCLSNSMEKAGKTRPPNTQAHHIVPENDPRAKPAQAILQKYGLINNEVNGVYLPNRNNTTAVTGITHNGSHPQSYIDAINKRIPMADARGGAPAVQAELQNIGNILSSAPRTASWYTIL